MDSRSEVVILGVARTPLGGFQGVLAGVPAAQLGAAAVRGALERSGVSAETVSDVLMGCVLQAGQGQAPARQAAMSAGIPWSSRAVTVHKVCGSGMQAVMQGAHALQLDMASVVIAGGMENMSQAPYLLPAARAGHRLGHQRVVDSLIADGLWDPYNDQHMGNCAEQCATRYGFSRAQQDAYAVSSFERANAAQQAGAFAVEIAAVEVTGPKGETRTVDHDEGPSKVRYDKIASLRPAFDPLGTITAANASTLNDGAAALVTTAGYATERGVAAVARVVAFGGHAQDPLWFTTAPVEATRRALDRARWSVGDVDLWEVNEAFAVVPMAFMAELGVSHDRVNVRGGAIALGHPIGCSGARIIVTLIAALRERGLRRGVAAICIGGGEGLATCVELM